MGTVLNGAIIQLAVIIAHLSENDGSNCCLQTLFIYRFVEISNIVKCVKSTLLSIVAKTHNNALNLYSGHALRLVMHRAREIRAFLLFSN